MRFDHPADPARFAELSEEESSALAATVVVTLHGAGKPKRKSFKKTAKWPGMALSNARAAALRLVFGEGFALTQPEGALRWLTWTAEPYPHGHPFAVAADGGVWLGDTGSLRRVEPGRCVVTEHPLGAGVMPRSVAVGPRGVMAVVDLEEGAAEGSPPWRAPSKGSLHYGVVRVEDGAVRVLLRVPWRQDGVVVDRVGVAADGRFLGPHADGAALYDADGGLLAAWPAARSKHHGAKGALSPSGAWVALTTAEGVRRHGVDDGSEVLLDGAFSQVHELRARDDGDVLVEGCNEAGGWGVFRLRPGEPAARLTSDVYAALSPDGARLAEVGWGGVRVRDVASGALVSEGALPWLSMSRHGRAVWIGPDAVVVRTDAHTLAEVDLAALPEPVPRDDEDDEGLDEPDDELS